LDTAQALKHGTQKAFEPEYADPVTYNGRKIPAHVKYGQYPESGQYRATAELTVRTADVPTFAYNDKVEIDNQTWRVQRLVSADQFTFCLCIERDARPGLGG